MTYRTAPTSALPCDVPCEPFAGEVDDIEALEDDLELMTAAEYDAWIAAHEAQYAVRKAAGWSTRQDLPAVAVEDIGPCPF